MGLFRSSWANGVRGLIVVFIIMSVVFIGISLWQTTSRVSLAPLAESQTQVTHKFSYFVEQSNPSSAQTIASQLDAFTTSSPDDIPFDLGNNTYWVLLSITNPSDQAIDLVLHLDNAMLFEPVAFDVNSLVSNQDQSLEEVIIRGQVFPRLEIMLPANNQRSLLLKLKAVGPPNIPLILYEQSVFANKTQLTLVLYGAFIAVILVMAVYNLVLFAAIKDVVYVLYVGYLLSSLIVLGSVIGFGYLIFPPEVQHFINQHSLFFHALLQSFFAVHQYR